MPAMHTPASFLGRSVDETRCPRDQPKSASSQPHKEFVSGRLSPRDAELLVLGATQEL